MLACGSGTQCHAQVHLLHAGKFGGIGNEWLKGPNCGQLWFTLMMMKSLLEGYSTLLYAIEIAHPPPMWTSYSPNPMYRISLYRCLNARYTARREIYSNVLTSIIFTNITRTSTLPYGLPTYNRELRTRTRS